MNPSFILVFVELVLSDGSLQVSKFLDRIVEYTKKSIYRSSLTLNTKYKSVSPIIISNKYHATDP